MDSQAKGSCSDALNQTLFCRKPVAMTGEIVLDRKRILNIIYYDLSTRTGGSIRAFSSYWWGRW